MSKYAVITGATAGFGKSCAEKFASNGWNLVLTGRRSERLNEIKTNLENKYQIDIATLNFDVREESKVIDCFASLSSRVTSQIRLLINNAGLAVGRGPIDEGLSEDWDRMIDTNIKGLLYVSKAVIPFLKANPDSQIINIGSIAGKEVYPGGNVYCASKHAVDAISKAMRIDLVQYGIKVTNIAPGAAETEFSIVRFKGNTDEANKVYSGFDPLLAEDIADAAWFVGTRPAHVNINDLVIMPTAQANTTTLHKETT